MAEVYCTVCSIRWELAVHGSEEHLLLNSLPESGGEECAALGADEGLTPNAQTCSMAADGGDVQDTADVEESVVECDAMVI
jgi:hypothetical protein